MVEKGVTTAEAAELLCNRLVIQQIDKFTGLDNRSAILFSSAMFAQNEMNGAVQVVSIANLLEQAAKSLQDQSETLLGGPTSQVGADWTFQTAICAMQSAYLRAGEDEEFLVVGLEDGSVNVINYAQERSQTQVFQVSDPHASFQESFFEHEDAIVSLDVYQEAKVQADEPSLVLSASREGTVNLWRVNDDKEEDYVLNFLSDINIGEPISSAKFLGKKRVVISTMFGSIWSSKLAKDSQSVYYLEKPVAVFRNDDQSAIMDTHVLRSEEGEKYQVITAGDSGEVRLLTFDHIQLKSNQLLTQAKGQSALSLSIDNMRHLKASESDNALVLTVGFNNAIKVLRLDLDAERPICSLIAEKKQTSDNVSSCKTLHDSQSKKMVTLFGTMNGRVSIWQH